MVVGGCVLKVGWSDGVGSGMMVAMLVLWGGGCAVYRLILVSVGGDAGSGTGITFVNW